MAITPKEDGPLKALLLFLQTYANERADAFFDGIGEQRQIAIKGLAAGQIDLAGVNKYPLMMGYRVSYSGVDLERCRAHLDYYLRVGVLTDEQQAALFVWTAKTIAAALQIYNTEDLTCVQITNIVGASVQYARVRRAQGGGDYITIPYLRTVVDFEDYESVG